MIEKLHPTIPSVNDYPTVAPVMEKCFIFESELRPTFSDICDMLNKKGIPELPPRNSPIQSEIVYYNDKEPTSPKLYRFSSIDEEDSQ